MDHLITTSSIASYSRPMSSHMDENVLTAYLQETEDQDIRPAIGDALFYYLLNNETSDEVVMLLDGGWYAEDSKYFPGLRKAVAYYIQAKIAKANNIQTTRFGLVQKDSDYSTRPSASDRNAQYRDICSIADRYLQETIAFLKENANTYPLFKGNAARVRNNRTQYRILGE